jgi:hypothetical protein
MGIIDQFKRLITMKRPATRSESESTGGRATAAADRLWHEHEHETGPVSHSDSEPSGRQDAKPEQSRTQQ